MGLLASVWAVGPAVLHSELPGASTGEAVAHAWGLSVAAEGLWTHGPFVRSSPLVGAPGGWHSDLVDPVNGLLFALWSGGLSVRWAWTLTLVGWLVAGGLGATALARRVGLDRGAALVLVVAWVSGATLHGGWLPSGRSELWPLMLWPAHLAALHGAVRGSRRDLLLAVGCLVAMAHGGWAPLLLLLPWQVAAAWMLTEEWVHRWRLVAVGGLAALLCLPMLVGHLSVDPWWVERMGAASPFESRPLGTRLSGLLTGIPASGVGDVGPALAPILWLAVVGHRRWFALGVAMLVASAGPVVLLADRDWWSPWAGVMHVLPPLRGLHGWPRVAHLAVLPLGLGLAMAVQRRPRWALAAVVALLGSAVAVGPGTRVDWPAALPAEGPVLDLLSRQATDPAAAERLQLQADRVMVGRWRAGVATSLLPSSPRPDPLLEHSWLVARLEGAPPPAGCREAEAGRLHALGFRSVVLHDENHLEWVQSVLGAGRHRDGRWSWTLSPRDSVDCDGSGP